MMLELVQELPFHRIFHQIRHIVEFHIGKLALARRGKHIGLPLRVDDGGEPVGGHYAPHGCDVQHVLLSVDKRQAFFGLLIRIAFPHVFLPYEVFRGGFADLQPVDNAFAGLGLPFGQQAALIFSTQVEVAGIV